MVSGSTSGPTKPHRMPGTTQLKSHARTIAGAGIEPVAQAQQKLVDRANNALSLVSSAIDQLSSDSLKGHHRSLMILAKDTIMQQGSIDTLLDGDSLLNQSLNTGTEKPYVEDLGVLNQQIQDDVMARMKDVSAKIRASQTDPGITRLEEKLDETNTFINETRNRNFPANSQPLTREGSADATEPNDAPKTVIQTTINFDNASSLIKDPTYKQDYEKVTKEHRDILRSFRQVSDSPLKPMSQMTDAEKTTVKTALHKLNLLTQVYIPGHPKIVWPET